MTALRIVRESAPLLVALVLVQMATGQFLNAEREHLFRVPLLLVLIPVVNGVGGNVGSVLGARLASALHSGLIDPRALRGSALRENVLSALGVAVVTYAVLALVVGLFGGLLGVETHMRLGEVLALLVGSGALLVAVLAVITVLAAVLSYRRGWDPDNTVIPIVTTFGDLLGVGSLLLVYGWLFP